MTGRMIGGEELLWAVGSYWGNMGSYSTNGYLGLIILPIIHRGGTYYHTRRPGLLLVI
jgi:hypothetical protein